MIPMKNDCIKIFRTLRLTAALGSFALIAHSSAWAAIAQHVIIDTYTDFAGGESPSTSISDTGVLTSAPDVKNIGDVDAGQIWSVLPQKDGKFLVGTSPDGKLFLVDGNGKSTLVTKFAESHIYAMARSPSGDVFVATSPDGKIFKLNANDKPTVYFEPNEKYIWSLLFDKNGTLYAATGTRGRIYRITGEGKGEVYYSSDETHIRSLAFDKEGRLLAGSSDSGYLYRISKQDDGVVLYSTNRQEVNHIVVAPDGDIYFSAVGSSKNSASSGGAKPSPAPGLPSLRVLLAAAGGGGTGGGDADTSAGKPNINSGNGGSAQKSKSSGINSQVFVIDASNSATEIWHTSETILTLDFRNNLAYAGTSSEGYLYTITRHGEVTRLLKIEGESISAAFPLNDDRFVLAASNPSRLFISGGARRNAGIYESDVIDSESFARWGTINLKATGTVEVFTRSGNTPKPDKSWYEWTAVKSNQSQSLPARYLQIQLRLQESAAVDRVEAIYLPKNAPPHVSRVEVLAPGVGYLALVTPPPPAQPRMADQILASAGKPDADPFSGSMVRFQPTAQRGLRTVAWKASDPNGDELVYTIYQRSDNSSQWHVLAKDYKDTVLSWDTGGWPDGNYYIKIVASDSPSNGPDDALSDELISRMFTIDNTPPQITILSSSGGKARFRVTDNASILSSVEISKDGKEYRPVQPIDGILDSLTEEFEVPLGPGEVLFIRAEDSFSNVKGERIEAPGEAPLIKK